MLTRVLRTVRLDTIDRRSQVGIALRRVQEDLTAQLGGPEKEITQTLGGLLVESNPRPKAQTGVSPSARESPSVRNPDGGESGSHRE